MRTFPHEKRSFLFMNKYYEKLDLARFISSFLIISIHVQFLRSVSPNAYFVASYISGVAVPLFFAASGFFLFQKFSYRNGKIEGTSDNLLTMLRYEKRLLIAYLFWSVVYFAIEFLALLRSGESFRPFLLGFLRDLFLNGSEYHLWYVVCLLWAVPLLYLFLRVLPVRVFFWVATVLFFLGQLVEGYSWLGGPVFGAIERVKDALGYVFQVPFRAFPFMGVGIVLVGRKIRVRRKTLGLFSLLFFLLGMAETYIVSTRFADSVNVRYSMFTYGMLACAFALLVKSGTERPKNKEGYAFLRKTSSFIYFVHPAVLVAIQTVLPTVPDSTFGYFFLASALSFAAAAVVVGASKKIKPLRYIY